MQCTNALTRIQISCVEMARIQDFATITPAFLEALNSPKTSTTVFFILNKGNNKITELRTILQRESQNS